MTTVERSETLPPPSVRATPWNWARKRLFRGPVDTVITIACAYLLYLTVPAIVDWAILSARWVGDSREACNPDGACWVFIRVRFPQFVYAARRHTASDSR